MTADDMQGAKVEDLAAGLDAWDSTARVLKGDAAAAHGRAMLEAAGVDLEQLARRVGRPHLSGDSAPGMRSPRVNVALPPDLAQRLDQLASDGRTRSQIVRDALAAYLETGEGAASA